VSERPLLYLVSTAGIPNLGDELIAATWVRHLAEIAPDADVVVDAIGPEHVLAPLRTLHPRVRVVTTLWRLCFRRWAAGKDAAALVAADVRGDSGDSGDEGIALLRRADVVHLTGGGFLNDLWPAFTGLLGGISAVREGGRARTAMTGVGLVPPIGGDPGLVRDLTAGWDVRDVRDAASAELLGAGATHTCDDAFLHVGEWYHPRPETLPEVMVSLQFTLRPQQLFPPANAAKGNGPARGAGQAVARRGIDQLLGHVAKTLADWGARDVGLLECWPVADRDIVEAARAAMPGARFFGLGEVMAGGFPARAGQTWLSTRFHPHLFAAAAGASGVALSLKRDYYGTKHGSLTELGSGWELAHFDLLGHEEPRTPARPAGGGWDPAVLTDLAARKAESAARIYTGVVGR
jgi:polysaccharide pyruvyl transferase